MKPIEQVFQRASTSREIADRIEEILRRKESSRAIISRLKKLESELRAEASALDWVRL